MPKRANITSDGIPRIIWSSPVNDLAAALRREAKALRDLPGDDARAELLELIAERVEAAVRQASAGEWILTEDAAPVLRISPDGVRARCRRVLQPKGLAKKEGGVWYIHTSAIGGAPATAAA